MELLKGLAYNLRGVWFGIKNPLLLLLGLIRFVILIVINIILISLVLNHFQEIMEFLWQRPDNFWGAWLWKLFSWLLSLLLIVMASFISYLVSQILFSVIIMDQMSRITEAKITGQVQEGQKTSWLKLFLFLIKQEIPRTILPVLISLFIMIIGFLTPLGPLFAIISGLISGIFLAWDNTDLVPARRMFPLKKRIGLLKRSLLFHTGFGLLFLIPFINIIFLTFAPIGATFYFLDSQS